MALPVTIPNTFANATSSIPLSQLDTNFSTLANAVNGLNSGSETLANLKATTANVGVLTVTGNATIGDASTDTVTLNSTLTANTAVIFAAGTSAAPSITTTGDLNTGIFFPAADTIAFAEGGAEAMRITSTGTVGIGTSSPNATLHTQGSGTTDGSIVFNQQLTATTAYNSSPQSGSMVSLKYNTGGDFAGMGGWSVIKENATDGNFAGAMLFHTRANGGAITERMRIDSGGNVGIGVTPNNNKFIVKGAHVSGRSIAGIQTSESASGSTIYLGYYNSADSRIAYVGSTTGSQFEVWNAENTFMVFGTNNAERARITNSGYFKATSNNGSYYSSTGTYHELVSNAESVTVIASNTNASPYGYYCHFVSDPNNATNYVFGAQLDNGTWIYRIYSNGTVAARSDAKWKKNIETARDGYAEDLAKLRVVKYNWYNHEDGSPKELGLIAQEVEQIFPGLVQTEEEIRNETRTREIPAVLDEEGNEVEPARTEEYTEKVHTGEYSKSIKFSVFTPMLIKAVQELKAITDAQATRIEALEAQNAAFEARLAALEVGNGN